MKEAEHCDSRIGLTMVGVGTPTSEIICLTRSCIENRGNNSKILMTL